MAKRLAVAVDWTSEAVAGGGSRLERLLAAAVERDDLAAADVYTVGDLTADVTDQSVDELGLLLVALFLAADEGSLAIELSPTALSQRLEGLVPPEELTPWIDAALAHLKTGAFANVVGDGNDTASVDRFPVLTWKNADRTFLYFQKHLCAEVELDASLRALADRPNADRSDDAVKRALREVLEVAPLRVGGSPIRWDGDQLTSIGLALLRDFAIVSGGPGTGKTSVVLAILRCLVRLGVQAERIALAAPTGRAARRLSDSLRAGLATLGGSLPEADRPLGELSATTLHSLLEYHPKRGIFRRHEENPVDADLVLIDEASMVSAEQMAALLRALSPTCRLILLGDKDQLPSVDAGAVLAKLVPSDAAAFSGAVRVRIEAWLSDFSPPSSAAEVPPSVGRVVSVGDGGSPVGLRDAVVVLRTNHRSEARIRRAAEAINANQSAVVDSLPRFVDPTLTGWAAAASAGGCWWWEQTQATPIEVCDRVFAWAAHVYDGPLPEGGTFFELANERRLADCDLETPDVQSWLGRLCRAAERTRLLTLVRQGAWGCEPINEMLQTWLRRRSGAARDRAWLPGTPILIAQNDKPRGLFNGDVGVTVAGEGGPRVVFARHGGFVALPTWALPGHELGFALTVHKSQGSEFQHVLAIVPPTGARRLLTKELIYTAITRAKALAVVSASNDAFRLAIGRRIVRESGMAGR